MTVLQLIFIGINVSMGLIVLALALHATPDDIVYLLRRPSLLLRSFLSMYVVMTVLATVLVALFDLHPAIKIAIVALALSPVPPILPPKQQKAGGSASYVIGLLFTAAILSVVVVPVGIDLVGLALGTKGHVGVSAVAAPILITLIVPLVLGVAIRRMAPGLADRIARPASRAGTVVLVVAFVPVLIESWRLILSMVGNGTLLVLALFAIVGIALGHLLGAPNPDDRTVLALATSTRHPGVALAIAGATFPDEKAVLAVVLWHLVVGFVVCAPYVRWRRQIHAMNEVGSFR